MSLFVNSEQENVRAYGHFLDYSLTSGIFVQAVF